MDILNFILVNREAAKLIYTLVIVIVCFAVVLRTDKLFRLSDHQGIRYFRNAFFFYGLAFVFRYVFGEVHLVFPNLKPLSLASIIIFEYFMIMAGFFLLYSLIWKKFESDAKSSLFNFRVLIFHGLAIVLALFGFIWNSHYFLFISNILIFLTAFVLGIGFKSESKKEFLDLYLFVIGLNLFAWIVNLLIAWIFEWHIVGMVLIYMLNALIFLLFLIVVFNATRR